jgi:hypothetical protein
VTLGLVLALATSSMSGLIAAALNPATIVAIFIGFGRPAPVAGRRRRARASPTAGTPASGGKDVLPIALLAWS